VRGARFFLSSNLVDFVVIVVADWIFSTITFHEAQRHPYNIILSF
jgi:hypothetical protein